LEVVNDWAAVMTIDVHGGNGLIALLDQSYLLQIIQLVANGALR
jgi:hypothetical protein